MRYHWFYTLIIMEDEIEEILKNSNKQGEKIAISNLRHKPRGEAKVVD